jgi:glycerol kinase
MWWCSFSTTLLSPEVLSNGCATMKMIKIADEINAFARSVPSTSGVYFVTALSGLLAPYWDPGATGLLVGLTSYTTPHVAHATLEANAFQTAHGNREHA